MSASFSRDYYAKRFGIPTDILSAKRYLKDNPFVLDDKMLYIGVYTSVIKNDIPWVQMIIEHAKAHLPAERRKGMLSFCGWLQMGIANEHEELIDYLLQEFLSHEIDEHHFHDILLYSVTHTEEKVLHALLNYNTAFFNPSRAYFDACCEAVDYNDTDLYQKILPFVVTQHWDELEQFLLTDNRDRTCEYQLFQNHKANIQRRILQENIQNGVDGTPRKI